MIASSFCSMTFNRVSNACLSSRRSKAKLITKANNIAYENQIKVLVNPCLSSQIRNVLVIYLKTTWSKNVIRPTVAPTATNNLLLTLELKLLMASSRSFFVAKPLVTCMCTSTWASACSSVKPAFLKVLAALCVSKVTVAMRNPFVKSSLHLKYRLLARVYQ